jgi:hypothetical protein
MFRVVLVTAALVLATATSSVAGTRLVAASPSTLELEGSSNVAGWRCRGTSLEGNMEVAAPADVVYAAIDRIERTNITAWRAAGTNVFPQPSFRMTIPVSTLRCGNRQMERDMGRALKSAQHPSIEFRFKQLRSTVTQDARGRYKARISGDLILAGERREIVVDVVAERVAHDRFRLRAEMPLRMTDFGITPPTALLGMVKARNELIVRFDLIMEAQS